MPIIIKKGSDIRRRKQEIAREHRNIIDRNKSDEDDESSNDIEDLDLQVADPRDMTDVLDFKIYRTSKPNFQDNSVTTKLVGELFYDEDDVVKATDFAPSGKRLEKEKPMRSKRESLEELRCLQYKARARLKAKKGSLLEKIKADEQRLTMVSNGKNLFNHLKTPATEDLVEWAIANVIMRENDLLREFIELEMNLLNFDERKRSNTPSNGLVPSNYRSGMGGYSAPNTADGFAGINANDGGDRVNTGAGKQKAMLLSAQLDSLKAQGEAAFLSSIVETARRGSSSGMKTSEKVLTPKASGKSPKSKLSPRFGNKVYSKEHVTTEKDLTRQISEKVSIIDSNGSIAAEQQLIQSTVSMSETSLVGHNESVNQQNKKSPHDCVANAGHTGIHELIQETSVVQQHHTAENVAKKEDETEIAVRPAVPTVPPRSKVESSNRRRKLLSRNPLASNGDSPADSSHRHGTKDVNSQGPVPRASGRRASGLSHNHRKLLPAKTVKYCNAVLKIEDYQDAKLDTVGASTGVIDVETKEAIQEKLQLQNKMKKTVGYTLQLFNRALEKAEGMQRCIVDGFERFERTGTKLISKGAHHNRNKEELHNRAVNMCSEKEMMKSMILHNKLKCFCLEGSNERTRKSLGVSLTRDMQHMHSQALIMTHLQFMERATSHHWFITAVMKLRSYMRRMNNSAPSCCLKFIIVIYYIIRLDNEFTKPIFFRVLEATVTDSEDLLKSIVHLVVKIVREQAEKVQVGPREFLAYLESRNIKPSAELLTDVKLESNLGSFSGSRTSSSKGSRLYRVTTSDSFKNLFRAPTTEENYNAKLPLIAENDNQDNLEALLVETNRNPEQSTELTPIRESPEQGMEVASPIAATIEVQQSPRGVVMAADDVT